MKTSKSTSETGHAKNIANFQDLISFVADYGTTYNPTQQAIKLSELNNLHTIAKNALNTDLSNARIARNNILYTQNTGLYDIQFEVKKYVKSVFGTSSPQYNQIKGIEFTKPR